MAWHQKGLTKEDQERCNALVAKGLLDFLRLNKDKMTKEDELRILGNFFDLIKKPDIGKIKYNIVKKLVNFSRKHVLTKRDREIK